MKSIIESDKDCQFCGHAGAQHFSETDSLGYFAFCTISTCECFLDYRNDEAS